MGKDNEKNNNNRSYKGKRNFRKGRRDCDRNREMDTREDTRKDPANNPAWYIPNDGMLVGAYIPFNQSAGTAIDYSDSPNGGKLYSSGLAALRTIPTLGLSQSSTSPISNAMVKLWVDVRKNKSSYSPYDAAGLMQYVRAMADVYSYIVYLQRVYGIASTMFAQGNRFMPAALLQANCVKTEITRQDLASFRYGINRLITQAASFNVPATLPIFQRAAFMYQNVYTEGSSIKDQLYMYTPEAFFRLMWADDPEGDGKTFATYLKMEPFAHDGAGNLRTYSLDDLIQYGDDLMINLIGDEDINMMGADILSAYGPENMVKLSVLPEYYPIVPIFDVAVLEQMKNARPVWIPNNKLAAFISQGYYDVTQPAGSYLLSQPPVAALPTDLYNSADMVPSVTAQLERNLLLTTTTGMVTPELVMESTRLMYSIDNVTQATTESAYLVGACGSELIAGVDLWNTNGSNFYVRSYNEGIILDLLDASLGDALIMTFATIADHSRYDFLPAMNFVYTKGPNARYVSVNEDIDNFAILHDADVKRLHEMALLTLFGVNKF